MNRDAPFRPGSAVVWRSKPEGSVGFVFGCRVLLDESHVIAVVQPTGAQISRRFAARGGPNGRSVLPGTWDGTRERMIWDRPPAVRLHPVGRAYAVIRTWRPDELRFEGWYVNLEQPWSRTTVGFDSRDDILDVVVSDDLTQTNLKDEDELAFAIEVGALTEIEARQIHSTAEEAMADIEHRRWPFSDAAWAELRPSADDEPPEFPEGWDRA